MTTATLPANMKHSFVFPKVEIGQMVHWFHGGDKGQRPAPAIVQAVYEQGALDLAIVHATRVQVRSGVRHCDDPLANQEEKYREGGFTLTPGSLRLLELEELVNKLSDTIGMSN